MMILIDSDVLIEVTRARDSALIRSWMEMSGSDEVPHLRRYGKSHGVELGGALMAATTVAQGALLWTRNRKHYPMNGLEFYATQ